MKRKWSILIEYEAKNMKEFEDAFYVKDELVIDREWVKGIIIVNEEKK